MSLLAETQRELMDDSAPLGQSLRKCMVLATRLAYAPMGEWAKREVQGYPNSEDLPEYRYVDGQIVGNVVIGFNQISNYPVPEEMFEPDQLRNLTHVPIIRPIAQIQQSAGEEIVHLSLAPYMLAWVNAKLRRWGPHQAFQSVVCQVTGSEYLDIVENVRTRTLEFLLEVERLYPDLAVDDSPSASPPPKNEIEQVFRDVIVQGDAIFQNNPIQSPATQIRYEVKEGDPDSLRQALSAVGVEEFAIDQLLELMDSQPDAVEDWIENQSEQVETQRPGVFGDVGRQTIAQTLATMIVTYAPWIVDQLQNINF